MASNGLLHRAKTGKCRICQRVRKTDEKVKAVGEVRRGYATGHIWECIDTDECDKAVKEKLQNWRITGLTRCKIETALKVGRFSEYIVQV